MLVLCIMEVTPGEIKEAFTREVLNTHGDYVMSLLKDSISDLSLIDQGNLLGGISYKIQKKGNDFALEFSFTGYGRAIEIAFHRRKKQNTRDIIKQLYGVKSREDVKAQQAIRKRKDTRWYSRNVYGALNTLIGRYMYGFTEEEIERLKSIITTAATSGQILVK